MSDFYANTYNPDVLSCLANLSNDEVFTPPDIVNNMLDMLPQEIFNDKTTTFLDPACKSGVFLREIAKRLLTGLKKEIPDLQERIDHIFQKQLYGIAITEITSLLSRRSVYCSKFPNSKYSVTNFNDAEGNIRFKKTKHNWRGEKCTSCGASKSEYDRDASLESHAYEFIHTDNPEEVFNMKFDVIIGNPPYQLETGGAGRQAKPIYNLFVNQAKKLKPRYLSMIIPSRWFSGGFGLDEFRKIMLGDKRMREIVDFPNSADVFTGVDIAGGICYFLWNRDSEGLCKVTNIINGVETSEERQLDEYPTFIRDSRAVPIVRKIFCKEKPRLTLENTVSVQKPFGLPTNYKPEKSGVPCWFIQRIGRKYANRNDIIDSGRYLDKWKLLVPKAPIAGQTDFTKPVGFYYEGNTRIAEPGVCCTESWIVAGAFETETQVLSFKSYLFTKTVRFLLLQTVISQDVLRNKFCFIPALEDYNTIYSDTTLRERWSITDDEWEYIDSRIHNYSSDIENNDDIISKDD
ncbi:MAG: Eco57I restriction-modification methylase domain-containing protein [Oscillospiraceae bacterium]|nr:Eco57I restriction-modification methylase domain-containing protein [Oscillospiraceae bacterium]